jgi:signal transduction histidine kinase
MANIDCKKIEQVLINLLLNAVKYSTQGSNVEVTIWQAQNNEELISILRNSPHISLPCMIVCVRDSGVGIPENELELVFEKYYRVDNKLNRTVHGMGMGLYICKVIVEAHGGHIWAKSNDGRGSTFAFSVPLQESASVVRQLQLDLHCEPHSPASRLETFSVNKVKAPM